MTPAEANVLLTKAGMIDPRMRRVDPGEAADRAEAWAELLADVALADALEAVQAHYRASKDALMPSDVLELVGVDTAPAVLYRDITPEILEESKARALAAAGVTEAEYLEHEHDVVWLRSKFPQRELEATLDEDGEPE